MKALKCYFSMIFLLFLSSCTFHGYSVGTIKCENTFYLTDDFNKRFPNQGDYFDFIKDSTLNMYYYENPNSNNCHYYIEYKDGLIIDEWGEYEIDGKNIHIILNNGERIDFEYSYYNSPTIDYILLGSVIHDNKYYNLVYYSLYIFSTKG